MQALKPCFWGFFAYMAQIALMEGSIQAPCRSCGGVIRAYHLRPGRALIDVPCSRCDLLYTVYFDPANDGPDISPDYRANVIAGRFDVYGPRNKEQ